MNDERAFELVLDEVLQMMAAGASRDECLARFPEHGTALAPLLAAAEVARAGLHADDPIPAPDLSRGRRRLLLAARPPRRSPFEFLRFATAMALAVVLVFIGVAAASANTLPGDALYPVKRGLESAQLALTLNPAARATLQAELSARRRAETQAVINLRRETQVEFEGVVERVGENEVVVSGLVVRVEGTVGFQPGDQVSVEASTTAAGAIVAGAITPLTPLTPPRPAPEANATPTAARPSPTPSAMPNASPQPPTPTLARPTATFIPTLARPTGASPIPSTPTGARPAQVTSPTATLVLPTDSRPSLAPTETRGPEATPTPGETRPATDPTSSATRAGRP